MKRYILKLTENVSERVIKDFDKFEAKIIYSGQVLPNIVIVETERSIEDIKGFFLVKSAEEERLGRLI